MPWARSGLLVIALKNKKNKEENVIYFAVLTWFFDMSWENAIPDILQI